MTYQNAMLIVNAMGCKLHHVASRQGYTSRKDGTSKVEAYVGKFGVGYIVTRPRYDTTTYETIEYWISDPRPARLLCSIEDVCSYITSRGMSYVERIGVEDIDEYPPSYYALIRLARGKGYEVYRPWAGVRYIYMKPAKKS